MNSMNLIVQNEFVCLNSLFFVDSFDFFLNKIFITFDIIFILPNNHKLI